MNFTSVMEELDRLYDEPEAAAEVTEEVATATEADVTETTTELKEDGAEEEAPVEEVDAEVVTEEPKQLILECDKCGALVIKDEADIKIDEESGLVNIDEACAFCEETAGYKTLGVMIPYEASTEDEDIVIEDEEVIEEGIFDKFKKKAKPTASAADTKAKYADSDFVVVCNPQPGVYTYVSGTAPTADRKRAEEQMAWINRPTNNIDKTPHKVVTYAEAQRLVGLPYNG